MDDDDSTRSKYGGESSTVDVPEPPPPTRQISPPLPTPPPVMGYPPAMGYPPGYPNPNGFDNYHQPGHSPPEMHYQPSPPDPRRGSYVPSNVVSFLAAMTLFVFFTLILGLMMFFVSRPAFPVFHVETLTVTNFSVANDQHFTSAWEISLVIENKNLGATVHFDRIQSSVYFNSDDLLVSSHFDHPTKDVTVKANENGTIDIKLSTFDYTNSVRVSEPGKRVMEEMRSKRKTGVVPFGLRVFAWSQFQAGLLFTESTHVQSRIVCEDLKVYFEGESGNGKLNGRSKDCEVDI